MFLTVPSRFMVNYCAGLLDVGMDNQTWADSDEDVPEFNSLTESEYSESDDSDVG